MSEQGSPGNSALAKALPSLIRSAREQSRAGAGSVLDVLSRTAGMDPEQLATRLESEAGVRVLRESAGALPDFSRWDRETARRTRSVVLQASGGSVFAAEDPWDEALVRQAARATSGALIPAAIGRDRLQQLLGDADLAAVQASGVAAPGVAEGPIVAFVDDALRAAYDLGASDVHFECDRSGVTAKLRNDGVLARFARLDGQQQAQEVVSRIKVLAQLDITERRLPQDGRCRLAFGNREVDMRVSIMPSVHGEDAVLRLLDKAKLRSGNAELSLDRLGFEGEALQTLRHLAALPSGMLLVTGPTGSGKTTTVYAALSEVNTGAEKLITIEDPVEYELPGVLQIPVNDRKGLTFARGLRSILRHDPDRILVGEIRDAETAEIAVQSALTGHQVFTTVHANSLGDVVGRFRHFGLDMFGFMSSLNGVLVQRLVRSLCPACMAWRDATSTELGWLERCGLDPEGSVPQSKGCAECRQTGYRGRFVVAEVHIVDDALRDAVVAGASASAMKAHAAARSVVSLAAQAAQHVKMGRTTAEEVRRVVGWG